MINNLDYHLEVKLGPWNSNDLFDSLWKYNKKDDDYDEWMMYGTEM